MRSYRPTIGLACALAGACAGSPEPFAPAPIGLAVRHERVGDLPGEDNSPQLVHIELIALRRPLAGPSLDLAAAALTAERGAPFRGASGMPTGAIWLAGDAARAALAPIAAEADAGLALALAKADAFPARDLAAIATATDPALPTLRLQCGDDDGVQLRVVTADRGAAAPAIEAHLAEPLPPGGVNVLFVPAPPGPVAGHAYVLTRRDADPAAAAAARAASTQAPADADGWPRRWRIAFQSVGQHNRRPPLLEIARTLGASRCRDALLVADEQLLIEFTERLARELTPQDATAPWPFERALWRSLLPRLERDELPDALHAHCLRQLGAMADDTGALRIALDASADEPDFVRAVREDNLGALGDLDAAWRARGLDWLRRQGVAVPGFDPLADDATRRAALRAFLAAEAAAEARR